MDKQPKGYGKARSDLGSKPRIAASHAANYGVYGARKLWIARCTVERLMVEIGPDRRGARDVSSP